MLRQGGHAMSVPRSRDHQVASQHARRRALRHLHTREEPGRYLGGGTGRGGGVDGAVAQPGEYEQVWGCHLIPGVRKGVCLCRCNEKDARTSQGKLCSEQRLFFASFVGSLALPASSLLAYTPYFAASASASSCWPALRSSLTRCLAESHVSLRVVYCRIGYFGGQTQYTTRRTRLSQYLAACGVVYGRGGAQLS
eukprot:scaffold34295_cov71-Phaeocystis_antarctica.AAC.1